MLPPKALQRFVACEAISSPNSAENMVSSGNNMMLDARGNLVEMFSNDDTGSWTMTVTMPGGPTCVMTSGESFVQEIRAAQVEERDS